MVLPFILEVVCPPLQIMRSKYDSNQVVSAIQPEFTLPKFEIEFLTCHEDFIEYKIVSLDS